MRDHPLFLKALNHYVKAPLEGSFADTYVFEPLKTFYLDLYRTRQLFTKYEMGKLC
jgi:hypothetical protein